MSGAPSLHRVVTTISQLDDKGTEFLSSLWELDPAGHRPARRITHGATGESSPEFTADGDLLFLSINHGLCGADLCSQSSA